METRTVKIATEWEIKHNPKGLTTLLHTDWFLNCGTPNQN